jgi:hypothetical protein
MQSESETRPYLDILIFDTIKPFAHTRISVSQYSLFVNML